MAGEPVLSRGGKPARTRRHGQLGFRVDTLFGNDWQFTKEYGLFTGAFTPNQFAGLDLPQIYGEIHLPILTPGGLDIKGGDSTRRPDTPPCRRSAARLSRVPYSMNYTPFTFFGVLGTFHLTDRINLYGGTINGFDRWIDESYKWGYLGFATWKSRDEKTNMTLIGASAPDQLPRFAPANAPYVPTATTPPSRSPGRTDQSVLREQLPRVPLAGRDPPVDRQAHRGHGDRPYLGPQDHRLQLEREAEPHRLSRAGPLVPLFLQ